MIEIILTISRLDHGLKFRSYKLRKKHNIKQTDKAVCLINAQIIDSSVNKIGFKIHVWLFHMEFI